MAHAWRFVIGECEGYNLATGDGLVLDQRFDGYDEGRAALVAVYAHWRDAVSKSAARVAAEDEAWLEQLPRGCEFVGCVEGDDHLLIRSDRTDVGELWDERERIERAAAG